MRKSKQKKENTVLAKSKRGVFSKKQANKVKDTLISAVISSALR